LYIYFTESIESASSMPTNTILNMSAIVRSTSGEYQLWIDSYFINQILSLKEKR